MSKLHGSRTYSETSEETSNTDTSTSCNFAEEISKEQTEQFRNNLVGNFHDLMDEIMNMKSIIIKKLQDKNTQMK